MLFICDVFGVQLVYHLTFLEYKNIMDVNYSN